MAAKLISTLSRAPIRINGMATAKTVPSPFQSTLASPDEVVVAKRSCQFGPVEGGQQGQHRHRDDRDELDQRHRPPGGPDQRDGAAPPAAVVRADQRILGTGIESGRQRRSVTGRRSIRPVTRRRSSRPIARRRSIRPVARRRSSRPESGRRSSRPESGRRSSRPESRRRRAGGGSHVRIDRRRVRVGGRFVRIDRRPVDLLRLTGSIRSGERPRTLRRRRLDRLIVIVVRFARWNVAHVAPPLFMISGTP